MPRQTDPTKSKQYRIDHGLCPECGKEAAPYYLCHDHRSLRMISGMLNLMAKRNVVTKEKQRGRAYFKVQRDWNARSEDFSWRPRGWELSPDDKRFRPRLGRRPVDLDETLMQIFIDAARPLTIEEVVTAWGRLRSKRKTASLAGDMTAIIEAQRRRDVRNAKRAAVATKIAASTPTAEAARA